MGSEPQSTKVNKKYSDYLCNLRDSGVTNMFGASAYLQREFGLSRDKAIKVLSQWMESFK